MMDKRTIGIGIVAVVLILAISMTASARPDPNGATTQYLGSWDTDGAQSGTFTDGHVLTDGEEMEIQLRITTAVSAGSLVVNITYTNQSGGSATTSDITISTTDGELNSYISVTMPYSGDTVRDITNVQVNAGSGATEGDFVIIATETTSNSNAADSDIARGGYISNVDLSASTQTAKWQGYFGEISGMITLQDASGNQMYKWDWVSASGGTVFAVARATAPIWTDVADRDVGAASVDMQWGYGGSADSANITFDDPDGNTEFDVAGSTVATGSRDALYTLLQNGTASTFEEVLLTDQTVTNSIDDFIFACRIDNEGPDFQGGTSDYQLIVPDTPLASTTTTYYFYVEMT